MIRRKLNKKKGFKGFKVIIDTFVLKELEKYKILSIDQLFDEQDKKEIEKVYNFYENIK
ncbi:hypothetical protein SAMN05216340_10812 [Megamonas sp. Calf98-2]|uniref:hypothetical protein n=1 Tax=Megamonas sp. Calf98-2 TaxID=1855330 RepID=UPI0008CCD4B0|nr:hypothetical protein [Megamonas sp. Calf98-2]SEN18805.1 hypothetical protein SAMN05216340_10812 [Megamonas sp. Calf98-2]